MIKMELVVGMVGVFKGTRTRLHQESLLALCWALWLYYPQLEFMLIYRIAELTELNSGLSHLVKLPSTSVCLHVF